MMSSARIKVVSLLSLCLVLVKSLKTDFFLYTLHMTCYITNIHSYTTYGILLIALLKLSIFKEIGERKNLVQGPYLL